MAKKKTGYVVPHTHWDREWRYPLWENRMYLRDLMEELLETLEKNPDYKSFLMDGQMAAILDYLEICPQDKERVEKLIEEGRIAAGPWYTLPDLYPVSGESLIRNLEWGKRLADKSGGCLSIGYESFGWGQPSQMPQIYQGFGIDTVIVSKNVDKSRAPKSEFIWVGADGTEVLATRLGNDARANFFMNAYLKIMTGKDYKSEEYEYKYGKDGQIFHQADGVQCVQDYFRLEDTEKIHPEFVKAATMAAWDGMKDSYLGDDRIMMDGTDSTTAQPRLMELLNEINGQCEDINFCSSSLEEYVNILKQKLPIDKLQKIYGEMRDGPTTSLSGNALMTRPHIKTLNKRVQNKLFHMAEPAASLLYLMGEPYEGAFLEKAINYLLLSHPHDSINGVTQDKTVNDVIYRLSQAEEIADAVYNRSMQKLLKKIDYSAYGNEDILLVVFNPMAVPRRDILKVCVDTPQDKNIWDFAIEDADGNRREIQELERREHVSPVVHLQARPYPYYTDRHLLYLDTGEIPAGGYQLYRLVDYSTFNRKTKFWAKTRKTDGKEIGTGCDKMENEFLSVLVEADGSISITDKRSKEKYHALNYYESTGDVGDYWMYYPPYQNKTYTSKGMKASIYMKENGNLSATIGAELVMELPAHADRPENYIRGNSGRSISTEKVRIITYYTLKKGAKQVETEVVIENRCRDHRMSVVMDTNTSAGRADAQGHFTIDSRNRFPLEDENGKYYNELMTQPMQNFVSVYDGRRGLSVMTDCLGEYEYRRDSALALTLFRAVRNIICTEFRSEGYFPNQEGGQLLQTLSYHYAIAPLTGNYEAEEIPLRAQQLNVPLKPIQTTVPNVPAKRALSGKSLFEVSKNAEVSCLKKGIEEGTLILRVYNTNKKEENVRIRFFQKIAEAFLTDLKEKNISKLTVIGNEVEITLDPDKIGTIKLLFDTFDQKEISVTE